MGIYVYVCKSQSQEARQSNCYHPGGVMHDDKGRVSRVLYVDFREASPLRASEAGPLAREID